MFSIYKKVSEINDPKVGQIIDLKDIKVQILEVVMKGFFYVDEEECYRLRVKKV